MRVLAVSSDANLITAITSMMRDWEIDHVRDASAAIAAPAGATIALIATGSTEKGLEDAQTLWQSGVTLPCLIIGDVEPPPGARARVLVRPFTLQDLTEAVTEVEQGGPVSPYEAGEAAPEPEEIVELEPEPHEPAAEVVEAEEPDPEPEPETEPEPKVLVGHDPGQPEKEKPVAATKKAPAATVAPPPPAPVAVPAPPPAAPSPPPAPVAAPAAHVAAPPEAPKERKRFMRRRGAEAAKAQDGVEEDPMVGRLKAAIISGRELERLLQELPVLGQPRAMAHAFLGEVVEMFAPQVAAVYAPGVGGDYGVIAAHGLSSVEAGMKVAPSQPLFMEITTSCEAVLISPVDLAQGLVGGIGGARTEALMVSPMEVAGICHAIVIVGRQDFSEFDLDLLSELAEEAAPGLAVAQLLERLRSI